MKTEIYFVRHASIEYIEDEYSRPLSEKGKQDVQKVTKAFEGVDITKVISSPYLRAIHTVEGIAKERGLEIETIDDLRERKVAHGWIEDFTTFAEKQWGDFDYYLEGGESLCQARDRGLKALFHILERYEEQKIVIGTHGTLLGVLLNYFDAKYDYEFWKAMKMPDIFRITFVGNKVLSIENILI